MTSTGQMIWLSAPPDFGERPLTYFVFDVGTGLTDVDLHPITDRNWPSMASPTTDAIAVLQAPALATLAQLDAAVQAIATKGGYRVVQVVMRAP